MEWFEQVKDTVKKTASAAYDKSEQLVEITKLKFAINGVKNEIDKLYTELGKLCYKAAQGEDTKDAGDEIIKAITEKSEALDSLNSELLQVKNIRVCPKCGKPLPEKGSFCAYCGEKSE